MKIAQLSHLALFALVMLTGCESMGHLYPANDLAEKVSTEMPAHFTTLSTGHGNIQAVGTAGEVLRGDYEPAPVGYPFGGIFKDVYGQFSTNPATADNGTPTLATLSGSKGTTLQCEFYNNDRTNNGFGACKSVGGALSLTVLMFTGIIQDVGLVKAIDKSGDWTLSIAVQNLPLEKALPGASVACNGICLTLIEKTSQSFKVQVSAETLSKTNVLHWREGTKVNLEPALRLGDELGGHMVTGHIDGVARVIEKRSDGESQRLMFEVPKAYARFIAPKGSITLDGVSLTVNDVDDTRFGVNIIPHTLKSTTLGALDKGAEVNFEVDVMARYAARLINLKG